MSTTDALPVVAWGGNGTFISDAVKQTSRQWFASQYPTALCTVESARAALAAQAEKHAAELAGLEAVRAEQAAGREYWCNEAQRLTAALKKANDQAEHFERQWYLRGDELEKLQAENFALAAGQCANVVGDEGGTPRCKEIDALRAERDALKSALQEIKQHSHNQPIVWSVAHRHLNPPEARTGGKG